VPAGIEASRRAYSAASRQGYEALERIEASPTMTRNVTMSIPTTARGRHDRHVTRHRADADAGEPAGREGAAATDLRPHDAADAVTQRDASAGLQAIKNILDAPDYLPASMVDMDLSAIKALARESAGRSHGLSAQAVRTLETELQRAIAIGGRPAQQALAAGRRAHVEGIRATELLESLKTEPAQLFKNLTQPNDAWLNRLRAVAREAPEAVPQIARAFLDELINKATQGGGLQPRGRHRSHLGQPGRGNQTRAVP
jgi:hypothetical protein